MCVLELARIFAVPTVIRISASSGRVSIQHGAEKRDVGGTQTRVTIFNTLEGHGFGKLIAGFAVKAAAKDADAFAQRIKAAVEAG